MLAAKNGHDTMLRKLHRNKANINQQDRNGYTALMHASQQCAADGRNAGR